MAPVSVLNERTAFIQKSLAPKGIKASVDSPAWSEVQAVLARGDERLANVLAEMDSTSLAEWRQAIRKQIDSDFLAHQPWPTDRKLPWHFIDPGVSTTRLKKELEEAV